jgi:hypothetical protein
MQVVVQTVKTEPAQFMVRLRGSPTALDCPDVLIEIVGGIGPHRVDLAQGPCRAILMADPSGLSTSHSL